MVSGAQDAVFRGLTVFFLGPRTCVCLATWLLAGLLGSAHAQALPKGIQKVVNGMADAHRPDPDLMHGLLNLSRSRFGSGTSWEPASSPMYGLMRPLGKHFALLIRGNIYVGYAAFSSRRGRRGFFNSNTLLAALWGRWNRHEWASRLALSWEALTNRGAYPHLLQTNWDENAKPSYGRQTPKDVFNEISTSYSVELGGGAAFQLYAALVGEAALGPTAFNYRVSALSDPLPPLAQSILEIGPNTLVFTAGVYWRMAKIEASWFNARRSAEKRYDIDIYLPRSLSARLSLQPHPSWSTQLSYGYLNGFYRPWIAQRSQRLNASVTYNWRLGTEANWATTFAVGARRDHARPILPAAFLESAWNIEGHHSLFSRFEYVSVHAQALGLPDNERRRFGNFVFGYAHYFRVLVAFAPGIGVRGAVMPVDRALGHTIGTRLPLGIIAYVQLRPAALASENREIDAEAP